jgi:hypothetical protein
MLIGAAVAGLAALPLAGPAGAKDGDVRVTKACSGPSDIKIKLSPDDGRLEVEIEVDQNRNGVQWTWTLLRGQRQLATGKATTRRPSGSFEVRRLVNDNNGTDTLTAKATRASGERCTVTARI